MATYKGTKIINLETDDRVVATFDGVTNKIVGSLDVEDSMYMLEEHFKQRPLFKSTIFTEAITFDNIDDILNYSSANKDFEIVGTGMDITDALTLVALDLNGGVSITSDSGASDQAIIQPHTSTKQSIWNVAGLFDTNAAPVFETIITTGTSIASTIIIAGFKLTNTTVLATDDDQVFFRYEDGVSSGKWVLAHSRDGTDTSTVSDIAVAASTTYRLKIVFDRTYSATPLGIFSTPALTFKAYINGALVGTDSYPAMVANEDLKPYVGVQGVSKNIKVRKLKCGRLIGNLAA